MTEERKIFIRKERIYQYLDNLERQIEDLEKMPVPGPNFFLNRENFERIKAIKYSLVCAIQDVTRVSLHVAVALGLTRVKESEAEAILALGDAKIIPKEFANQIKGMPSFRNRLIHDYLPNEFDAERLYSKLQHLNDFRKFARYIVRWLEEK